MSVSPTPSVLDEVSRALRAARDRLDEEVVSYPRPIPACDVQFNTLLEQRAAAAAEYARWEALRGRDPQDRTAIRKFLYASCVLGTGEKERALDALP